MSIFKNVSGEHAPGPPKVILNSLKLTLPEKTTLEKVTKFGAPSLIKKCLNTPLT